MNNIKIIDAIMGSGKSTYVIEEIINKNPDKKFICVVPTIDKLNEKNEVVKTGEVGRYKQAINMVTYEPHTRPRKLDDFKRLIANGKNIVTTHSLIQNIDIETMELIKNSNYTLIIDECLDVIHEYPKTTKCDIKSLIGDGWVFADEKGFLIWNEEKDKEFYENNYNGRWSDIKRLCNMKALMCLRKNNNDFSKNIFFWNFPVKFFDLFVESYICTYLWEGSIQKAYFDLHNVVYKHLTLSDHKLIDYDLKEEINTRKELYKLIKIYNGVLNSIGTPQNKNKYPLSKTWYKRDLDNGKYYLTILKNNTYNYFRNIVDTVSSENMYTTFKDFKKHISKKGYARGFVSCSSKGTNEYKNKKSLAYLINLFLPTNIIRFFTSQNIEINSDLWSLAELLQWIFRSRIREGKEINLFIPSERMRELLKKWSIGDI